MNEAGVVVLRRNDGAILMQHRDNLPTIENPNYWSLPGGRAESEHPRRAAIRELWEEARYLLAERELILLGQKVQNVRGSLVWRSFYLALYDGKQTVQCYEGQKMDFVHPRDLNGRIITDHLYYIQKAEERLVFRRKER